MRPVFAVLFFCNVISFNLCEAQTKRTVLSEVSTGFAVHTTTVEYSMFVNLETNDTTYNVKISFLDDSYPNLASSIILYDYETVAQFRKDLEQAIPEIGKKIDISWNRKYYTLSRNEITPLLYIYDEHKLRSTGINKRSAKKILAWFKSIDFKGN